MKEYIYTYVSSILEFFHFAVFSKNKCKKISVLLPNVSKQIQ